MDWQVQPNGRRDGARRVGTGTRETTSMMAAFRLLFAGVFQKNSLQEYAVEVFRLLCDSTGYL
jgi:hypothetical protein